MSDNEKKQNKITAKAGLTFNVNAVKSKLKDYHESHGTQNPMYGGGQTAMTAVLEKFYEHVLRECATRLGKEKSGVKQVNCEFLQATVLLDNDMRDYCVVRLNHYDPKQMYRDQVPFDTKQMDLVMARVDKDMALTPKARNLACYLLLQVFLDVASTSDLLQAYAKKKTLDGNCVSYAARACFSEGLAKEFCDKVAEVMKEFGEELDTTDADVAKKPQTTPTADAESGEEDAPAKNSKGGKKSKEESTEAVKDNKKSGNQKSKNQKAQPVEADDSDDDAANSDEEVQVQPKQKNSKGDKEKEKEKEQQSSGKKNQGGKNNSKPAKK